MKKGLFVILLLSLVFIASAAIPAAAVAQDDTDDDTWIFQDWCYTHVGCGRFGLKNKTDGWLQVTLTYPETGEQGFFTVPPKGYEFITLRPGSYTQKYVYWCDGKMYEKDFWNTTMPYNQFWTVVWRCGKFWPYMGYRR